MAKYKIKDLAADFGMQSKEMMQIVEKFYEKPKSNSQALEEDQLNVIFDYITQTNQIESLEVVFAVQPAPKKEAPKQEEKPAAPKSNWCTPPFYYYTKEDAKLVQKGIDNGCGTDAPGSYIAWLCSQTPVYAMEMPGTRSFSAISA